MITGAQLIGLSESRVGTSFFYGIDPKTNATLDGEFAEATAEEVDLACTLAERAFTSYLQLRLSQIANFLDQIADELLASGDELIERAMAETALPRPRLEGERGRTMNQLHMFAGVVREGSWVEARIDPALPDRKPMPRADIRQMARPLGPVAVFGASNFPLAFSVAGGDTASALAAGCPVVAKAHPAHPGTSEIVGRAILRAAEKTGMPVGVFSLVQGRSHEVGGVLVKHPLIKAVGFTGSLQGGKTLWKMANDRPEPIPVFAEMGSTNPVFLLPGALASRAEEIGTGLAKSVMLGVGQFCTNPGLVFVSDGPDQTSFAESVGQAITSATAGTMLTTGIKSAYEKGVDQLSNQPSIEAIAVGKVESTSNAVSAKVFQTGIDSYLASDHLQEEVFGPSTIIIRGDTRGKLLQAAEGLTGHLTATVHGTDEDLMAFSDLIEILHRKVGRIIINGFPTGVEVCHAMVHGGPFPATTAPHTTSVGTLAIRRFVRPLCFQDFPQDLLPDALKDSNPLGIWRLVNGAWSKEEI